MVVLGSSQISETLLPCTAGSVPPPAPETARDSDSPPQLPTSQRDARSSMPARLVPFEEEDDRFVGMLKVEAV
jgi:hypothetical protein